MVSVRMEVTGMKELSRALEQLPRNIGVNVLRGAAYAGAAVIRNKVGELAPTYSGSDPRVAVGVLKKAVYAVRSKSESTDEKQVYFVGIRRGRKEQSKGRDAYYWTWVEFGHHIVPRVPKGGGSLHARRQAIVTGSSLVVGSSYVLPHPFFRPAYEASKDAAAKAIRDYMAKRIPLEIEKARRA